MRIAYVCYWDAYSPDGVVTKIRTQTSAWREAGHGVTVFCLSPGADRSGAPALRGRIFPFYNPVQRVGSTARMIRAVSRATPDVIYLRFDRFIPTLTRLFRRFPTVVEVNGDDRPKMRARSRPVRIFDHLNRHSIYRGAAGFVAVSNETRAMLAPFGKPTVVIANGVDLAVRRPLPPIRSDRLSFVLLVGARLAWHGVDKVLELAAAMPDCDFTLIGVQPDRLPGVPAPNVAVHPLLPRDRYEPLLAAADVALGPLAMHRVECDEISSIKVPEYLAYGLPVVIGYQETDFIDDDRWFLLRLPNNESNVRDHVAEIRRFAERVRGRRVQRDEIARVVDSRAKENQRLAFLESFVARS